MEELLGLRVIGECQGKIMYNPWYDATMLALNSSGVILLRAMRLAGGGPDAQEESHRMVSEKILANASAASVLMAGGSLQTVIAGYQAVVDANTARLLTPGARSSR